MKKITVFNTAICSENIGDYIIMDSVNYEIYNLFYNEMIFETLTHDVISKPSYRLNKISDFSFIGGTNLLSSKMNKYNQWKIGFIDAFFLKDILLLGVGWWQYQTTPNLYTKRILQKVLNKKMLHSVRDSYTEKMLKSIGIKNVINTGCPTMWELTEEHCNNIPQKKADSAVFTLTDYNKDIDCDQLLINILASNYSTLYFWPQGSGDYDYLKSLNNTGTIIILGANLNSFNKLLDDQSKNIDYIGTRLHAGIRSIQKFRRSIIIGIDNRAVEKRKDFNLKVLLRNNLTELDNEINRNFKTEISLHTKNIEIWRSQF